MIEENEKSPETVPESERIIYEVSEEPEQVFAGAAESKGAWWKGLLFFVFIIMMLGIGFVAYRDPGLFKAALTELSIEEGGPVPAGESYLYIPRYNAEPEDSGKMAVKVKNTAPSVNLYSISLTLKYKPGTMSFTKDSIVFDKDTLIKATNFTDVNTETDGELVISFFSSEPVIIPDTSDEDDDILFKISSDIHGNAGEKLLLAAEDVEVVVADTAPGSALPFTESTQYTSIDTGEINLVTQGKLKALYSEAEDNTHVRVYFSDYISNFSAASDYTFDPVLEVISVTGGPALAGEEQKTVLITTADQTAGRQYTLTIGGNVEGNIEGGIDPAFSKITFQGYGLPSYAVSDFGISAAQASAYDRLEIAFDKDIQSSSVNTEAFKVYEGPEEGGNDIAVIDINELNSKTLELLLEDTAGKRLLMPNSYTIEIGNEPEDPSSLKDTEGNTLGINKVTLAGYKFGPIITGARFVNNDTLEISFDEAVEPTEGKSLLGSIVKTGETDILLEIDGNYTVNGKSVYVTGEEVAAIADEIDENYTYIDNSSLKNEFSVYVDPGYSNAVFWSIDSQDGNAALGDIAMIRKKRIEITEGALALSDVTKDQVKVFSYTDPVTINEVTISKIDLDAENSVLGVISESGFNDRIPHIVQIVKGAASGTGFFTVGFDFGIESAKSIAEDRLLVKYSENIDQATIPVDLSNLFKMDGVPGSVIEAKVQPGYQEVVLTIDKSLVAGGEGLGVPGRTYIVETGSIRSYTGGKNISRDIAAVAGFQTEAALSSVKADTAEVLSPTSLKIDFTGDLDKDTVTPVNINILYFEGGAEKELSITKAEMLDNDTIMLYSSAQIGGQNYFIEFKGVKDTLGLNITNTRMLNFTGFMTKELKIENISPASLSNDLNRNVVISGQGMESVAFIRVGSEPLEITEQSDPSLTFVVPQGFKVGIYDITLTDSSENVKTLKDSLSVTRPERGIRIIEEESKAVPYRVSPAGGSSEVTFWVLVEDPLELEQIDKVTINLRQLGGIPDQEMEESAGSQYQYRQFYKYTTVVPENIPTKEEPYQFPVEVRKGDEVINGFVEVLLTADVLKSVAPMVESIHALPSTAPPDGETVVVISAKVSDQDGSDAIASVYADTGGLGMGFVKLDRIDSAGAAGEQTIGWYASSKSAEGLIIPKTAEEGDYAIVVTATDNTGETGSEKIYLTVSKEVNGPKIEKAYISPRSSVANDGKTPFSISAMVSDPDGISDIDSVTAYFGTLGLSPIVLQRSESSELAQKTLFTSGEMTVSKAVPLGIHEIELVAVDKGGGTYTSVIQLDVTFIDAIGDSPKVFSDKSYTTPKVAVNDGKTSISLYAFVRDDDEDLETVMVNLNEIGQVGAQTPPDFGETGTASKTESGISSADPCSTGSNTIVCMNPSYKEGNDGQWFVLSGVTVSADTAPSSEAYKAEVIATDATGKTSKGYIPVYVHDGESFTNDKYPPEIMVAVATSPTTLEVLFNEEINAASISPSGKEFTITDKDDINDKLGIQEATISATGMLVTLTTDKQEEGKIYVLSGSNGITDAVGVRMVAGAKNRVFFDAFEETGRPPMVEYIAATDVNMIEAEFRDYLKPSSVKLAPVTADLARMKPKYRGARDLNVEVYETGTSKAVDVVGVEFGEAANILEITTEPLKSGQRYRVRFSELQSPDGSKGKVSLNKMVKGFKVRAAQKEVIANQADLNADGKVDFLDFTMFSAVYGQVFGGIMPAGEVSDKEAEESPGPFPIEPEPDSTVPHTTVPTGDAVPSAEPEATSPIVTE